MLDNDVNNNLFSKKALNTNSISSLDTFNTRNNYSLNFFGRSSYNSTDFDVQQLNKNNSKISTNNTATSSGTYNSTTGYGLINSAAAVARVTGQNTFADVPDLGGNNWGADLVKAPEAWAQGYTGQGVVVAVVDTGVDHNHEDLRNNIWTNANEIADNGIDDDGNGYVDDNYGWNFSGNNNNTLDGNGHGTHVSGTIAGENNNYGVTGIAYNAKIMPVKVLNDSGSGSYNSIAKGIRYAVDNGADVINLSLGGRYSNRTLESAINYASSKGVIVVMAAGNDGDSSPDYPARYASKSGIAVGAVDRNNNIADFSNRSGTSEISYVTAPGVNVYSTVPNNEYDTYSGTSMAAPHVAGVVALMLSANPNLTDAQVRQIVAETSGNSTQSTAYSLNISNVNSLTSQAMTQTAEYLSPKTISNFNNSDFGSIINQTSTEITNFVISETISSFDNFDIASVSDKAITETTKYLTPEAISSLSNFGIDSMSGAITKTTEYLTSSEDNKELINPQFWNQYLNEEPIFSNININNEENNQDGNNIDFGKLVEQMQKQLEQLEQIRKFLGLD
ncbi:MULTISPECIES: S8 family peptidase [Nostoc]|uniref:S8 family serine peptidase n=1 Tax=Nostoc paludosum FACHB-159 TaxID=2692908 RepID=A0ABR8KEI2_9NOSO|nr:MULTISPECIES: S8 family peptidase [Nostoc]MBD2680680.1 S8 family serine peptidase [Nostoc sp. FACHB-857]MBD2737216.1 S8 family serine peptidase [Nostoc paludosum FACHB-159]